MGWFGEGARSARAIAGEAPAEDIPATAECRDCAAPVLLVDGKLPNGWTEVPDMASPIGKSARCPDCTDSHHRATERRRAAAAPRVDILPPMAPVVSKAGADSPDRLNPTGPVFSGTRIYHWPVGDKMVIRMHGGSDGADARRRDPIHFLADAGCLQTIADTFAELAQACRDANRKAAA